jgi:hypothetical protein
MGASIHNESFNGPINILKIVTGPGTISIQPGEISQALTIYNSAAVTLVNGGTYKFTLTPINRGSDANEDFIGTIKSGIPVGDQPTNNVVITIISGDINGPYYVMGDWIYFYNPE